MDPILKITESTGEKREISMKLLDWSNEGKIFIGKDSQSQINLKDTNLPKNVACLTKSDGGNPHSDHPLYWIKALSPGLEFKLGDLLMREAELPPNIPVQMGETTLTLTFKESQTYLPPVPSNTTPWLTCAKKGRDTLWKVKKASDTPLSIYLSGETGTGKEILAKLIHMWSPRAGGPFIPLHCAALPANLAESELFGHVKGSFTGATHHRTGALMRAHNGTLFLDEIGDLSIDLQVKLLRFLENGEIRPVGSDHLSHASVRIICATHHSLSNLVEEGKFRRDLYYRLASVTIEIPSLRERPEDIELLAHKYAHALDRRISKTAIERLQALNWPGNVRELRHTIEQAAGLAGSERRLLQQIDFEFLTQAIHGGTPHFDSMFSGVLKISEMEKIILLKALKIAKGNRTQAAEILGVARSTLFEMLKRHKVIDSRSKNASLYVADSKKPMLDLH